MNDGRKSQVKRMQWTVLLVVVMILSSAFTLLDAFVIPKSYVVVEQDLVQDTLIDVQNETEESAGIVEASTSSIKVEEVQTEVIITDYSYIDENINISIEKIEEDGVVYYVADVQLSDISYLKTAFANNTFGKNITQETSEMAEANDAIFAINGDYYGFRDTGLVIRNGVLYRDFSSNSSNDQSLTIDSEGNLGIVAANESTGTELIDSGILQGFTFGPTLVLDGEVSVSKNSEVDTKSSSNSNPRTAVGQISPLHYIIIVVDGRTDESNGMTLQELAQEFVDRGATVAYNLDGGGSAAMWLNGNVINNPTSGRKDGERKISDIIYIGY